MNRSTHAAAAAIVALALVACGAGTGAGRSTTAYGASFPEEITSANLAEMLRVFHSLPEDEGARPVLRERILTYYARSNGQLGDMDMEALGEHLGAMTDLFSPAELADDPLPQALIPVAEALVRRGNPRGDEARVMSGLLVLRLASRPRPSTGWSPSGAKTLGGPCPRGCSATPSSSTSGRRTPS